MRGTVKTAVLAVLVVVTSTACTRRVQVESEPNRYEAAASQAEIDIAGSYDYTVLVNGERIPGTITVRRVTSGYAVDMTSSMGQIRTSNVRREGNTLTMDAVTPGGDATMEMTWTNRNTFTGIGFLGGMAHDLSGTRRQ